VVACCCSWAAPLEQVQPLQVVEQLLDVGSRCGPVQAGGHRPLRGRIERVLDGLADHISAEPQADGTERQDTGAGADQAISDDEAVRSPAARGAEAGRFRGDEAMVPRVAGQWMHARASRAPRQEARPGWRCHSVVVPMASVRGRVGIRGPMVRSVDLVAGSGSRGRPRAPAHRPAARLMGATPSARIVAVEPGQPGFVTLTVLCPLCGRHHQHGTRAKGLGPPSSRAEPRPAVRTSRSQPRTGPAGIACPIRIA